MLKLFEITNYKNFKDKVVIDFSKVGGYQFNTECISNDKISKILIYGRNATGKTNLGNALFDINFSMLGGRYQTIERGPYLNADSTEKAASFKYVFEFDSSEITYKYKKLSEYQLYEEELLLNGSRIFYYNFVTKENQFDRLEDLEAETVNIERYLEAMNTNKENDVNVRSLPFLRWMINNTALKDNSLLLKMNNFIECMDMLTISNGGNYRPRRLYSSFYDKLEDKKELKDFEDFLNVMGIECEIVTKKLPDGQIELYFKHEKLVPFFETASSGTLSLVNLYRRIVISKDATLIYMDEFDAFYHYEMSVNLIEFLKKKNPKSQIIMTTHNTNLMTNRLMRPDCLLILSRDGALTALCDATKRELREGHNLEKMYISGEFENYE